MFLGGRRDPKNQKFSTVHLAETSTISRLLQTCLISDFDNAWGSFGEPTVWVTPDAWLHLVETLLIGLDFSISSRSSMLKRDYERFRSVGPWPRSCVSVEKNCLSKARCGFQMLKKFLDKQASLRVCGRFCKDIRRHLILEEAQWYVL